MRASLQEIIDLSRLEGADEVYKPCYEDLSKRSETRYNDILRAIGSLREETKALRQTVGLVSAVAGFCRSVTRTVRFREDPSPMTSTVNQGPDSDLASAL